MKVLTVNNIQTTSTSSLQNQKHLQCTEEFHKSNVIEMLKGETGSIEDKQKMIEMLLREQEEEVHDEDEEEDLRERLGSLNIGTYLIYNRVLLHT